MSARLTTEAIDPTALLGRVAADSNGATCLFVGTVRNSNDGRAVDGIDYSAYEPMAIAEMARIAAEASSRFPGVTTALEHRIGTLRIGDVSVAIACAHAHRTESLDACRYVIEQLKHRVPIWKREHYVDGTSEWVDPTRTSAGVAP